jgi:hypothetical protein
VIDADAEAIELAFHGDRDNLFVGVRPSHSRHHS